MLSPLLSLALARLDIPDLGATLGCRRGAKGGRYLFVKESELAKQMPRFSIKWLSESEYSLNF
jgi:hypothetical protein